VLPVHPAADLFPLLPSDELLALGEKIKAHGLLVPVALWAAGNSEGPAMGSDPPGAKYQLLDGRNRLDAAEAVGLTVKVDMRRGLVSIEGTDTVQRRSESERLYEFKVSYAFPSLKPVREKWIDPWAYVIAVNIDRRHLTAEDKRKVIAAWLKAKPEKSNRTIAKQTKVDHKTVGAVREQMESTGEIPQLEKTVGKDGKARTTKPRSTQIIEAALAPDVAEPERKKLLKAARGAGEDEKRAFAFTSKLAMVRNTCEFLANLDIPNLSDEAALEAVGELRAMERDLRVLRQKIEQSVTGSAVSVVNLAADHAEADDLDIPTFLRRTAS
jgi:hypothetical protein